MAFDFIIDDYLFLFFLRPFIPSPVCVRFIDFDVNVLDGTYVQLSPDPQYKQISFVCYYIHGRRVLVRSWSMSTERYAYILQEPYLYSQAVGKFEDRGQVEVRCSNTVLCLAACVV